MKMRSLSGLVLTALLATAAHAQAFVEVSYSDDFQSYGSPANPAGWVDSSVGKPAPEANGLYKTWPDPVQDKTGSNIVFGTKQASGQPDGTNPRVGTFSTLTTKSFSGDGRFEYRGRFIRTSSDTRIGLTFFSSYPEVDSYYLVGLWSQADGTGFSMQLFSANAGTLTSLGNSRFQPEIGRWYQFLIQVDNAAAATNIRMRFWLDGEPEPQTFSIDTSDASSSRLKAGRIGVWSAVKGDAYFDDLFAKSPVDHTPPIVQFFESGAPLANGSVLNHDAHVDVRVADDISGVASVTSTIDGLPYTSGDAITADGVHTLHVHAVDNVGNAADAELQFTVDKTPPVVSITESGAPLASGAEFDRTVQPQVTVTDLTTTTVVATLDGVPWTSGTPIVSEGVHTLVVSATDAANWTTTLPPIQFVIDESAPSVTVLESGAAFVSGTKFNRDIIPALVVSDLTATTTAAAVDGVAVTIGSPYTTEGNHTFTITVTDHLGHATTVPPIAFTVDKTPPVVTLKESGQPLVSGTPFGRSVTPEIAIDDLTATTVAATLNGAPYTFGTAVTTEGRYALDVTITDALGWTTTIPEVVFYVDLSPPVVTLLEGTNPLSDGSWFNRDVTPHLVIEDTTPTTVIALLNGQPFEMDTLIGAEAAYKLSATVTDAVGHTTDVPAVSFTIDKTPPAIAFLTPQPASTVTTPEVVVAGDADDAITVQVNGIPALVDADRKFATSAALELVEGENALTATAVDRAGNSASLTVAVFLDTRPPDLEIASPSANACLDATEVEVRGTAADASLQKVTVSEGDRSFPATVGEDHRSFTAIVTTPSEGKLAIRVEAIDNSGHSSVAVVPIVIDRTKPVVVVTEHGAPFTATFVNRPVALLVEAAGEPALPVTATLDGQPYVSGTSISTEGAHELRASATDCAGHTSDESVIRFTIDRTAPAVASFTPASGSTVATKPAISGMLTEPAIVSIEGSSVTATVSGLAFTIPQLLEEGINDFTIVVTDAAGNAARFPYQLTVDTTAPRVEIAEDGVPIKPDALYRRAVVAAVRTDDAGATVTATLNGDPFTSGTAVSADGSYTLIAKAVDRVGNESPVVTATFRIDRTAPSVHITSPANSSVVHASSVDVHGTVGSDARGVTVNGIAATVSQGTFTATAQLDIGPNEITAIALDEAGNASSDSVEVTRNDAVTGLVLSAPPNGMLTNRTSTIVAGQVLTPGVASSVVVNGAAVPLDAAGSFRINHYALVEGTNTITASVDRSTGVTVMVTADFTAPELHVTANGEDLVDGVHFDAAPVIAVTSADGSGSPVSTTLTIDGTRVTDAMPALGDGGHALTAIAHDPAGNETRIDRMFLVGNASAGAGCALGDFDPPQNAAVFGETVHISGHCGTAPSVLINGFGAAVADGTFCGDAHLQPGRNEVEIRCADASGQPTSDSAVVLVLNRYDDAAIAITSPAPDSTVAASSVTVTGTVGGGITRGDVNGVAFTVPDDGAPTHSFSVPNISLAPGLNVIVAHAQTSSMRSGVATALVTSTAGAPQLTITSPLPESDTGASTIDVSGTYSNLDPSTIAVSDGTSTVPVATRAISGSFGTFAASGVTPSASTAITVTARNGAGTPAQATVTVHRDPARPAIAISEPLDDTYLVSAQSSVHVSGSIAADAGATVQVNGVSAEVSGTTFAADVPAPAGSTGATTLIARVTTPSGASSTDSIRVVRFDGPPAVRSTFPAADATAVDRGAAVVVLFNNILDGASVADAIHMTSDQGAVEGRVAVDRDAITFAPLQPLEANRAYTVSVATTLKDAAGASPASAYSFTFRTAATAPSTAPVVDDIATTGCFTSRTISGHVSTAGVRVRIEVGGVARTITANDSAVFSTTIAISGSGYHLVRVREIGSDGSLSAERAMCFRATCEVPQVLSAALDRAASKLTIRFSKAMNASTLIAAPGGSILLATADGTTLTGDVSLNDTHDAASIAFNAIPDVDVTLTVKTSVKDANGAALGNEYVQTFAAGSNGNAQQGKGYVTGAVYDATTGRPLPNASILIAGERVSTDARGRYTRTLAEGAYTIETSATGYTTVWRQIVVVAGAGIVPIDIRLTRAGPQQTFTGATTLQHGGDTAVTAKVELSLSAGSLNSTDRVRLTSAGAQSLAGLLPLGWSPLGAAEIVVGGDGHDAASDVPMPGATLTFFVDVAAVVAANQTLSLVQYDRERDEWRVTEPVANVASDGRVVFSIASSGNYALVYPDNSAALPHPPQPHSGAVLRGVANPCASDPTVCALAGKSFTLDPKAVLPNGRTVATVVTDGTKPYPSGTAMRAFIDEELNLSDGRVLSDVPFTTDLLIYRTLSGDDGAAVFHLAPSAQAATVSLRDGVDHIRIVDYPGRVDRGSLVGAEGGRVPGDDAVTIDIPAGATSEPLHASVASLSTTDLGTFGTIAGFHIAGGFTFTLTRATDAPATDGAELQPVALLMPAHATVHIDSTSGAAPPAVVIAEVMGETPFGVMVRLVALTEPTEFAGVYATRQIVSTELPLDGIIRDGRYLILTADAPIAYAHGRVQFANGVSVTSARVVPGVASPQTSPLGVRDLTDADGVFVVPVQAQAGTISIVAGSLATGDGDPVVHDAPAANAFVDMGAITIAPRPPHLSAKSPADGDELDADAPLVIQATFDAPIDPASIAGGVGLVNLTTSDPVAGQIAMNGANVIRFTPASALRAASQYAVSIATTVRGTNGASLAQPIVWQFSTRAIPQGNQSIHANLVHITLPDDRGVSRIYGLASALPAGAQAVAVRRGRYFIVPYQATVAADGSFSFDAGGEDPTDRISVSDRIDLQVIDATSRAIIAIIELTPFVSADGRGFLAPTDRDTTFTSADGITVTVPAGAFDTPTTVRVESAARSAFASVAAFDTDLNFSAGVHLDFAGVAHKRIEVDIPAPSTASTSTRYFLGYLGNSMRGPRVELTDMLRLDGTVFTTRIAAQSSSVTPRVVTNATFAPGANSVFSNPQDIRSVLVGALRSGIYGVVDIRPQVGWGVVEGLQSGIDLFWDSLSSLFVSSFTLAESRGRALVPVVAGQSFQIVGVDAGTGLETFRKAYDPLAPSDPTAAVVVPSPIDNELGPYPVFATPARIEIIDAPPQGVPYAAANGMELVVDGATAKLKNVSPVSRHFVAVNTAKSTYTDLTPNPEATVDIGAAAEGDRMVVAVEERDVDPELPITITFNQPVYVGSNATDADAVDEFLHGVLKLSRNEVDVTPEAHFRVESGNRRISVDLGASLQRGAHYELAIRNSLAGVAPDGGPGLKLFERKSGDTVTPFSADAFVLYFSTREPAGKIADTQLATGSVRDLALNGNVAMVAAADGGIQMFDVSDPAALDGAHPVGKTDDQLTEYWSIASDRHGRVFATGLIDEFGVFRSYRLDDFLPTAPGSPVVVGNDKLVSGAMLSWRIGSTVGLPLSSWETLSDRPEATPRKIQVALQDAEEKVTLAALAAAGTATDLPNGFKKIDVSIQADPNSKYELQRITVENRSLDLRWSGDAPKNGAASIHGIVARDGDDLYIVRNRTTYVVVSLFGYGVGVFDANAIESNEHPTDPASYQPLAEKVVLTDAKPCTPDIYSPCPSQELEAVCTPNPETEPCPIRDLSFSPEALITAGTSSADTPALTVYALEQNRGVLDLLVTPPHDNPAPPPATLAGEAKPWGGLALAAAPATMQAEHQRLKTLHTKFVEVAGREPRARFTSISRYVTGSGSDARDYALVVAKDYGIAVVKLSGTPLTKESLVDVVWIPAGAMSVRVMPGTDMAVAVDGAGRVLLIDLTRIDESAKVAALPECNPTCAAAEMFPTALHALESEASLPDGATWSEVGADDPRIVWKSEPGFVHGTLPPVVDPETGIVFTGDVNQKAIRAVAALDPRLRAVVRTDDAHPFTEVSGVVPLGVDPPTDAKVPPGALAAFRVELTLPGSVAESLESSSQRLLFAIESERIPGAVTAQTIEPFPPAHLRRTDRDGHVDPRPTTFELTRVVPSASSADLGTLRFQRGYNRFASPWVVTVDDPRAAKAYEWNNADAAARAAAGCHSCVRPSFLDGATAPQSFELYSAGRFLSIRPDASIASSPYAYLTELGRLELRLGTVPADTVRPPAVQVAANQPPVADGMLQETTYLHSGEVETSAVDFDAGGRAGWDVTIDRTYRSRTIGLSPMGAGGWDSTIFRRLRELPTRDVEYRDGAGEVWLFRSNADDRTYTAHTGLALKLSKIDGGWTILDQKLRLSTFDSYGRLVSESDEFKSSAAGSGNTIRYTYDANGLLSRIIDPVGRQTSLKYSSDVLAEVADWRTPARRITYGHDVAQRLTSVALPEVANTSGGRPTVKFTYQPATETANDRLEIATNLESIIDPNEASSTQQARVTFTYEIAVANRDRVTKQKWGTTDGATATFEWTSPTDVAVTDVLGQKRRYTLTQNDPANALADRAHVTTLREVAVPVWTGAAFGQLPAVAAPAAADTTPVDRVWTFAFENGLLKSTALQNVSETVMTWRDAPSGISRLVESEKTSPLGVSPAASASLLPSSTAITREWVYQSGTAFLAGMRAGGREIKSPEPHRDNENPSAENDSVTSATSYDANGLPRMSTSSGGNDGSASGAESSIDYVSADDANKAGRGLPKVLHSGTSGELDTKFEYAETQTVETDPRGVITTTDFDTWQRPVHVTVMKLGDPLIVEQKYNYDANGRLHSMVESRDGADVTTTYRYDIVGRQTEVSRDGASVGDGITFVTTKTSYDMVNRHIVTERVGGAATTTDLDSLGRTARTSTETGGDTPIEQRFAYDIAGNQVYSTDMLTASATAFDAHGRAIGTRAGDGTLTTQSYDDWDHPQEAKTLAAGTNDVVSHTKLGFTDAGRLASVETDVDAGVQRMSHFGWDGGGRSTVSETNGRVQKSEFDLAGRLKAALSGSGGITGPTDVVTSTSITGHDGFIPWTTRSTEKGGGVYTATSSHDTAGNTVQQNVGSLTWKQQYDALGNVVEASVPGRPATSWKTDSRGAVTKETLPGGATNDFKYDANGAPTNYADPTAQATSTVRDLIGRPTLRTYPDGTTEEIRYERSRIAWIKDRQGRRQEFRYNAKGQLDETRDGDSHVIERLTYDDAGRLIAWTNADAEVRWLDFDLDGHPKKTVQTRFKDGTGLNSAPEVLDQLTQEHRWNEHGEREAFSMPSYTGQTIADGWTRWLRQSYDAMGNVGGIGRVHDDADTTVITLMSAAYRSAGRPSSRTVYPKSGPPIVRNYGYDAATSQLNRMAVTVNDMTVAGSGVNFDGLQVSSTQLLGNPGRATHFRYDDRSRVVASLAGVGSAADPSAAAPGRAREDLTSADFRSEQERTPHFDEATTAQMKAKGVDPTSIDPPTSQFQESAAGHKIDAVTRGPVVRPFGWQGAERVDDGRFIYEFDVKGRLVRATEKTVATTKRRITYAYSGTGRVVGRRAEYTTDGATWRMEDRPQVLSIDGLPAETTYAWDPISDRLVAVYRAGASASDANGGLLKQIIHGDASYDDPLETTTFDAASGQTSHLYPVFDEAGAGTLQAVLNDHSEVVARNLSADPYGAGDISFSGAAIDGAKVTAHANASGAVDSVDVMLHATEPLVAASVANGVRLATVDRNGAVVRTTTATPALAEGDATSVHWTLTPAEWTALIDPSATDGHTPVAISIAATSSLRASAWSADTPLMPAPIWATTTQSVHTSPDLPVEVRASLPSVAAYATAPLAPNATEAHTLYEAESLSLLGTPSGDTFIEQLVSSSFQALPFVEPATGLVYARARWYDAATGSFLSPDPLGYRDSSNLYAFAGGDPVNGRDPEGLGILSNLAEVIDDAEEVIESPQVREWASKARVIVGGGGAATTVSSAVRGGIARVAPYASAAASGVAIGYYVNRTIDAYAQKIEADADAQLAEANYQAVRQQAERRRAAQRLPKLPGVTPYSQQAGANPALANQLTAYHNIAVGNKAPRGSVRKSDYPTRPRKATRQRLEAGATDAAGVIHCENCGVVLAPGEGTPQHVPALVETHNTLGWDTDQSTRNDLFNDTATNLWCLECQVQEGGQTKTTYRRDTGPNYKPRPRRKK